METDQVWEYHGQKRPPFAEMPGPGGESVWDYPRPPKVSRDARHVIVRAGKLILADSRDVLRVLETASPPTFYLPAADVDLHGLRTTEGRSVCEWKGVARYWSLRDAADKDIIAWDYPQVSLAFTALTDHLAFYPGRVECYVDEERVRPQPGGFYGGWVTDEVVGPFKGEPGTGHW